jgi:hypothetical protein
MLEMSFFFPSWIAEAAGMDVTPIGSGKVLGNSLRLEKVEKDEK